MKIGLVGYQRSGKSTLFQWLTGVAPDPALSHTSQTAMATIVDPRLEQLAQIYHPKKVSHASLEIVDTPGLSRTHAGNAARLASIREAGCLIHVVAAFDQSDPAGDLRNFEEDALLADLEIVANRAERVRESLKKPRPNRDELTAELHAILPLLETLEAGQTPQIDTLTDEQEKLTRSFQLLTLKRRMAIVNVADDETDLESYEALGTDRVPVWAIPVGLENELNRMDPEEREAFRAEMGVPGHDRDALLRRIMDFSGQMLFFTAGEKEVRAWLVPQGVTAVEAAATIHTDLARGFIRAEVMRSDDLIRTGSERELKAHHQVRQEPKDYVVQQGDILFIRFSV